MIVIIWASVFSRSRINGSMDHVDSLFQDCMTHIVNSSAIFAIIMNILICACVSLLQVVFVMYYNLQVHSHVTG